MLQSLYAGKPFLRTRVAQLKNTIHCVTRPVFYPRQPPVTFYATRHVSSSWQCQDSQATAPVGTPESTPLSASTVHAQPTCLLVDTATPSPPPVPIVKDTRQTLEQYKADGKIEQLYAGVNELHELRSASRDYYHLLLDAMTESYLPPEKTATVLRWFSPSRFQKMPVEARKDIELWCKAIDIGIKQSNTHYRTHLSTIMTTFDKTFTLTVDHVSAWEYRIKAWGVLIKKDKVEECMKRLSTTPNLKPLMENLGIREAFLLAFANAQVEDTVHHWIQTWTMQDTCSLELLTKLTRSFAYQGNPKHTEKYMKMTQAVDPTVDLDSVLLLAHQRQLQHQYKLQVKSRGVKGLYLRYYENQESMAWGELVVRLMTTKVLSVTECNRIVSYMTLANSLGSSDFPMKRAEDFVDFMETHSIPPDGITYAAMLSGYSRTKEYKDTGNTRLDKTLGIVGTMIKRGIDIQKPHVFQALLKACIPHRFNNFTLDYFKLNSALAWTNPSHPDHSARFQLDPRFFEIEKLMLESNVLYDRMTFITTLTCLGGAGLYSAMWGRWAMAKKYGLQRDLTMYQHIFALASRDSKEAAFALLSVKSELSREYTPDKINPPTYLAMLDCCIASQNATVAKQVIDTMRKELVLDADEIALLLKDRPSLSLKADP
ncbi:hypothetical protein BDF14DRAFT_1792477 [Spinellus fusiger]|nr:hypothetical protein BDF14DRAFT_1792477 [Spinellus fusiger]